MTSRQGVEVTKFSAELVGQIIRSEESAEYLAIYLTDIGVRSVIIEHHYVDRHYLDEYSHYYSKSFTAPSPYCQRYHFFSELDPDALRHNMRASLLAPGKSSELVALERAYAGYCVIRPLPSAPLGRTVLKTYPAENRRHYEASRPYVVHLCGLTLAVDGLAFQHQDGGAAVCASTSLWSALQRVAFASGHRTPTPYAITEAAGSPYPASHGLTDSAMAMAIRKLGYSAEYFAPADNRAWFRSLLVSSLMSRLPVILTLGKRHKTGTGEVEIGHAVTVTGFSEPVDVVDVPFTREGTPPIPMRAGSLSVLYAHDDNLGPHAHYELMDSDSLDANGHQILNLRRGNRDNPRPKSWPVDDWRIEGALVPKPEKLRLALPSMLERLEYFRPALERVLDGVTLNYSGRFDSGIAVQKHIRESAFDANDRLSALTSVSLPRHVGILSAYDGNAPLCDFVMDATDVGRDTLDVLIVLASGVERESIAGINIELLGEGLGAPVVFATALDA